jgi:gamma-glutamylcyclotransferase (GGCT)/AIG2-like uncharacterized protein YtfP
MTEMRFFIYGSMSEGLVHFSKISDFISSSEEATIQSHAYRLKVGYPVLVEGGQDLIPGQLVTMRTLTTSELLLSILDEFHGFQRLDEAKSLYIRREIIVETGGHQVQAWCYFLNPKKLPSNAARIEGGDWKASLRRDPPLTAKLTDRQRNYVQRLGASIGREIVPIDLGLYRELMNLELIVDKGRRLALSKLGQEVYRYL